MPLNIPSSFCKKILQSAPIIRVRDERARTYLLIPDFLEHAEECGRHTAPRPRIHRTSRGRLDSHFLYIDLYMMWFRLILCIWLDCGRSCKNMRRSHGRIDHGQCIRSWTRPSIFWVVSCPVSDNRSNDWNEQSKKEHVQHDVVESKEASTVLGTKIDIDGYICTKIVVDGRVQNKWLG